MKTVQLGNKQFKLYISQSQIKSCVQNCSDYLVPQFQSNLPVLIPVMNGALPFAHDLIFAMQRDFEWSPLSIKSYDGMQQASTISLDSTDLSFIKQREVVVVEDIIDSGRSMEKLLAHLHDYEPARILLVTLLLKPAALTKEIVPDYVGFEIPNDFVVGYGMDYDERGRYLPDIYVINS